MSTSLVSVQVLLCLSLAVTGLGQNPYILNGSATQHTCNCYVLTRDVAFAKGRIGFDPAGSFAGAVEIAAAIIKILRLPLPLRNHTGPSFS